MSSTTEEEDDKKKKRPAAAAAAPDHSTMHGMIWNANHVLDTALDPKTPVVPRSFFEQCRGVVLIALVEAGFIFTGSVGTGVLLARDRHTGKWSPPSAILLAGMGFGFVVGADLKNIIIVLMDDQSLRSVAGQTQLKLGAQMSITVGPVGREVEGQVNVSDHGPGVAFSWSFSKGLFGGVSLEGAILEAKSRDNERYYGKKVTPYEILFGDEEEGEPIVKVPDPPDDGGVYELWDKLELMQKGKTKVPTRAELQRKESLREEADEVGRKVAKEEGRRDEGEVTYVDAKKEARKEGEGEKDTQGEEENGGSKEKEDEKPGKEGAVDSPKEEEGEPKQEVAEEREPMEKGAGSDEKVGGGEPGESAKPVPMME